MEIWLSSIAGFAVICYMCDYAGFYELRQFLIRPDMKACTHKELHSDLFLER